MGEVVLDSGGVSVSLPSPKFYKCTNEYNRGGYELILNEEEEEEEEMY